MAEAKAKPRRKKRGDRRGTPKGKATRPGAKSGRIGNPPFVPTDEQRRLVKTHVAVATPQWAIAKVMGISEDTLQRHFKDELEGGLIEMLAQLGGLAFKQAFAGDSGMIRFVLARRGGEAWKQTTAVEASGPNGGPIEYRNLSDEELDARIAVLTGNAAASAKG